jgi:hypothetical protein
LGEEYRSSYIRITSTKSPLFYMETFSTSLKNPTAPLPQSHDSRCYVRGTSSDPIAESHRPTRI